MSKFTPFDPCPFCKGTGKQIGDDCRHCGGEGTVVKSSVRYATPEMYEALKALLAAHTFCESEQCETCVPFRKAHSAIQKAEGRTADV